jgi:hypothetical protein
MEDGPRSCVWTFTELYYVDMGSQDEVDLGDGPVLVPAHGFRLPV